MSTGISIDEIDSRVGHLKLIFIHWNLFAYMAWDGYREYGRGAVIIDLRDSTPRQLLGQEVHHRMGYLGERSDVFKSWPSEEVAEKVEEYEPEDEIIVIVYGRDYEPGGDFSVYRLDHGTSLAPPDVYDEYNSIS